MRRTASVLTTAALAVGLVLAGCGGVDQTALGELEDCVNGVDDNGDGLADCDDPQCTGHAYCLGMVELNCTNGADDDDDGDTDCADTDCLQTQACDPTREWNCFDGVDNDGDGNTDCDDRDCDLPCTELCDDGVDNNYNGQVDCEDPACFGSEACHSGDELCGNNIDDDGDGYTDCEDSDCAEHPICLVVELCNTEVDEDGDGLESCADPDCATSPYCSELQCLDSVDNDGDGYTDCEDSDCANAMTCQQTTECLPAQPLPCNTMGSPYSTVGRRHNLSSYPCLPSTSFPGGERYFQYTAPRDMYVDVLLNDINNIGLMMFATSGDPNGGCDFANDCIPQAGPLDPFLPVIVYAGATMFLVIDSTTPTPGPFELLVDCTPADETGLCSDGLDNDFDGWWDCEDIDCAGDPQCDYWVSAGTFCTLDYECPAEEYCEHVTFSGGSQNTVGFCTRSCTPSGTLGGQCATDGFGDGLCSADHSSQGPRCLLPCDDPSDTCPNGNVCTNLLNGSTDVADLTNGFCLPIQP